MKTKEYYDKNRRVCKNCIRWYNTKVDQCNVPDCGMFTDPSRISFSIALGEYDVTGCRILEDTKLNLRVIDKQGLVYGKPSVLNVYNACYFYKEKKQEEEIVTPHTPPFLKIFVVILSIAYVVALGAMFFSLFS